MIGTILGNRYRIIQEIGAGGMAKVYRAEDINEGRLIAVKILYPHFSDDVAYLQRFNREAKFASLLSSDHIVKILDYGSSRDVHYLVMEYVEGKDLREYLNEHGPLAWQQALNFLDQVCQALENAHQHNVVHRDIKPHNLMITKNGLLKVLDFGIARTRLLPSLTQSGFVGSPYYISPEQAMGEDVDIRSDIYATGVVLYEMLTGKVPFDAKSPWSIVSKHITAEPPDLTKATRDVPPQVHILFKRMVVKNRAERLQTPTEVRKVIAKLLTNPADAGDLIAPPPEPEVDLTETAENLYERAEKAIGDEDWQTAVNLLNQTLNLKPKHKKASQDLAHAGLQARLAALHKAATQAMERGRWQEAIDELTEIQALSSGYKDSDTLLEQARMAMRDINVATQVSEMFDNAKVAFDEENYQEAEALFARVHKIAPNYKHVDQLLAETRKKNSFNERFKVWLANLRESVNQNSMLIRWVVVTAVVVMAIVAVVFAVSRTAQQPEPTPDVAAWYANAETAVAGQNFDTANKYIDQILAVDENNQPALYLRTEMTDRQEFDAQLDRAKTAIATKDWTAAIKVLEPLSGDDDEFPAVVADLLCEAYLLRGQNRLAQMVNVQDLATVQAALADFSAGAQACPDDNALSTQFDFASGYLLALQPNASADIIVTSLEPIIETEPDYAAGLAVEKLYLAYLDAGKVEEREGDFAAALDIYNQALALKVDDLTEAQEKQAAILQQLAPTATPESAPEATPQIEPTATPEPTLPPVAVDQNKYPAPLLTGPEPGFPFAGEFTEIVLSWEPVPLADDEFYDVTIRYFIGDEVQYWGSGLIKEPSWRVPIEAGYGKAGNDEFAWWVTIRKGGTASNGNPDLALSPPSEERLFLWRP